LLSRRPLNRIHNVRVARAPAQVALEAVRNFLPCRFGIALEQLDPGHDHSGRAVAALQSVALPKPLLDRVQLAVARQSFDSGDLCTISLNGEYRAGLNCLALHQDGAGAANARFAADVRTGQLAVVAQEMDQQGAWFDLVFLLNAVDFDCDLTFHTASDIAVWFSGSRLAEEYSAPGGKSKKENLLASTALTPGEQSRS